MSGCPVPCRKARLISSQSLCDSSSPVKPDRATELSYQRVKICPADAPGAHGKKQFAASRGSPAAWFRRGYKDSTAGKYLWRKDAELCMFPRLEMVLIYLLQRLWLFAAAFCWKQLFQAHLLPLVSQPCSYFRIKLPKPTQTTRNSAFFLVWERGGNIYKH